LKGDEEVVGGFDLVFKKEDIAQTPSTYTTRLGCKCNRIENLKKLARACAMRLSKESLEKEAMLQKTQTKNTANPPTRFNLKKPKSVTSNLSHLSNARKKPAEGMAELAKDTGPKGTGHQTKRQEE
jgi:hypothetical protein